MKYTIGKFTIGNPIYLKEYGWNVEIKHPDHIGFFAQVSGKTRYEAVNNAKMIVKSYEMHRLLKEIYVEIEVTGDVSDGSYVVDEIKDILNELEDER